MNNVVVHNDDTTFKAGQMFQHNSGDIFMLIQIDENTYVLAALNDGHTWASRPDDSPLKAFDKQYTAFTRVYSVTIEASG